MNSVGSRPSCANYQVFANKDQTLLVYIFIADLLFILIIKSAILVVLITKSAN